MKTSFVILIKILNYSKVMATLSYYYILNQYPDLDPLKRFSKTILLSVVLHEFIRFMLTKYKLNDLYSWVIFIDVFLLGVIISKYKNIKILDFIKQKVI